MEFRTANHIKFIVKRYIKYHNMEWSLILMFTQRRWDIWNDFCSNCDEFDPSSSDISVWCASKKCFGLHMDVALDVVTNKAHQQNWTVFFGSFESFSDVHLDSLGQSWTLLRAVWSLGFLRVRWPGDLPKCWFVNKPLSVVLAYSISPYQTQQLLGHCWVKS